MESSEPNVSVNAGTQSTDAERLADDWLRRESTKLVMSSLDWQRKARRNAVVLFWSTSAYVCVAAVGYAENESTKTQRLESASARLADRKQVLAKAESNEKAAFNKYLDAVAEGLSKKDNCLTETWK